MAGALKPIEPLAIKLIGLAGNREAIGIIELQAGTLDECDGRR